MKSEAESKVIKEVFREATVLLIAHRLENVYSLDRVLMMDGGKVSFIFLVFMPSNDYESFYLKIIFKFSATAIVHNNNKACRQDLLFVHTVIMNV
uniref:ABC transmembrane type-1 domain-containing protein n=1 Tax=Heterorhabditis bacteriophora TaxID=37862 RepID=A0A1I7WPX2_HETBA